MVAAPGSSSCVALLAAFAAGVAWLNVRGEAAIPADAAPADRHARPGRARRVPGTRGQLRRLPHRARRRALRRRARHRHAVRHRLRRQPDARRRDRPGPLERRRTSGARCTTAARRDGRLLYPAFPYPDFTRVTREDSDALYVYLRTLAPVRQANRPHALRLPLRHAGGAGGLARAVLPARRPSSPMPRSRPSWNRGAYLVRGLGHCGACHGGRNFLGATPEGGLSLGGGLIPMRNWYAPALTAPDQAGVADWPLRPRSSRCCATASRRAARVLGPMAEVVLRQHAAPATTTDLRAIAIFLKSLPQTAPRRASAASRPTRPVLEQGGRLYDGPLRRLPRRRGEGAPQRGRPADATRRWPATAW